MTTNGTNPGTVQTADASLASIPHAPGPRTKRGKAAASKNALRYGFFSKYVPIETPFFKENKKEFRRLLKALEDDWNPAGATELLQVELAAIHLWQYRRLHQVEQAIILRANTPPVPDLQYLYEIEASELRAEKQKSKEDHQSKAAIPPSEDDDILLQLEERVEQRWGDKIRRADQLEAEHERVEKLRKALPEPDELDWLQKCEERILRNYYRAISELERLQRMRLGDRVPPRFVVEVNHNQ